MMNLSEQLPDNAASVVAAKLDGAPVMEPYIIAPNRDGVTSLGAESSEIQKRFGQRAKPVEALGHAFIANWTRGDDVPTWTLSAPSAALHEVEIHYSAGSGERQRSVRGVGRRSEGQWKNGAHRE